MLLLALLWISAGAGVARGQVGPAPPVPVWVPAEEAEVPAGTWPHPLALEPAQVMEVSLAEADSTTHWPFRRGEKQANFRIVALTPDSVLYALADLPEGVEFAQGSRQYTDSVRLWRSVDRGHTWEQVYFRFGNGPGRSRLEVAVDPWNSRRVFIGANDGLVIGADTTSLLLSPPLVREVRLPFRARDIRTLRLDPRQPGVLYLATQERWLPTFGDSFLVSAPGLYRGWIQPDQYLEWEDIGQGLGAAVVEIGLPPQEPSSIWVRLADGRVVRGALPAHQPTEVYGWERLALEEVPAALDWYDAGIDAQPFLRVPPGYTEAYVNFRHWASGGFPSFRGFLFVQDGGALYAHKRWEKTGMYFDDIMRSVDGGVTWQGAGGFSGTNDFSYLELARVVVLLDVRGKVMATNKGLPRVPVDHIGPWAQDPVNPLIFYVAQEGKGLLYRGTLNGSWRDISQGLPLALVIEDVAVDSSATVYLKTDRGFFRRVGQPAPFRLEGAQVQPDTLMAGETFEVRVRRTGRPLSRDGEVAVFAEYEGRRIPMAPVGDGTEYFLQLQLDTAQVVGFAGIPVLLEGEGLPVEERASTRASFVVVPSRSFTLYDEGVGQDWEVGEIEGVSDVGATEHASSGKVAHRLEGAAAYQFAGKEFNPFGYQLVFEVWSANGNAADLRVDDFALSDHGLSLQAGG
ncbi:MAG: hypothetical protein IT369_14615, partial [Candidatus Latescibacteria bacterium]|nr:hypothetical protein [Candidatus Latescibacterota bacterium]